MPTKWLQLRVNGSKYGSGMGFEGPGAGWTLVRTPMVRSRVESTSYAIFKAGDVCTSWLAEDT